MIAIICSNNLLNNTIVILLPIVKAHNGVITDSIMKPTISILVDARHCYPNMKPFLITNPITD